MSNAIASSEIWNDALLETINPINVALNFANLGYSDNVLEMGSKVHVITPGSVSVGTYTKGTDLVPSDMTDADENLAITDTLAWSIVVDDIDRAQANPGMVAAYMKQAGKAMSRALDTYLFASYASANSANKIAGASNAAIAIDGTAKTATPYELLVQASVNLSNLDVPQEGRFLVVNPTVHGLLLKDTTNFVRASALGDMVVTTARFGTTSLNTPGFIGQILGFDTYVSANLPTASNKSYLIYGQGQPYSYISQLNEVEAVKLPLQFATVIKGLLLHGKKTFAEDAKRLGSIYVNNVAVNS